MLKWTDTEEGNVELLAMRTFSETLMEPEDSAMEETKKKSVHEQQTGELTACTFGFEGDVVRIEKTVTVSVCRLCRFDCAPVHIHL